jgi:flagellar motor switch protein FliN
MDTKQRDLVIGLADELATVAGALLGGTATASPGAGPVAADWVVSCAMSGPLTGRLAIGISHADAVTLAQRLMGMSEEPPDEAVADTVAEVASQAAGALAQQPVASGAKIRVDGTPARGAGAPTSTPAPFDVALADGTVFHFACWADLESIAQPAAAPAPTPVAPPLAPALAPRPAAVAPSDNLDLILDIELPLTVRFGRTEMTLQSLTRVGPGSVLDLDRSPDEPVDVLINDKVIARGEVVVVSGNYGVRITEVVSAVERIRTLAT